MQIQFDPMDQNSIMANDDICENQWVQVGIANVFPGLSVLLPVDDRRPGK